jgi:hypothetical protein
MSDSNGVRFACMHFLRLRCVRNCPTSFCASTFPLYLFSCHSAILRILAFATAPAQTFPSASPAVFAQSLNPPTLLEALNGWSAEILPLRPLLAACGQMQLSDVAACAEPLHSHGVVSRCLVFHLSWQLRQWSFKAASLGFPHCLQQPDASRFICQRRWRDGLLMATSPWPLQ